MLLSKESFYDWAYSDLLVNNQKRVSLSVLQENGFCATRFDEIKDQIDDFFIIH